VRSSLLAVTAEPAERSAPGRRRLPRAARARRAGARRYVDLHVQFRSGTTLEAAHEASHALQEAIRGRVDGADVLIHLEPEANVLPGTEVPADPLSEG
jgi:divalent metal cation (Fe/Co/Zn/Cd) transporter